MEGMYTLHPLQNKPLAAPPQELAQAYVRMQPLEAVFTPEEALRHGTLFPNLYQPYRGWNK